MLAFDTDVCLLLAWNKDTSHLAEFWILRDDTRIMELTDLMLTAEEEDATQMEPDFALQPYTEYHRGKPKPADKDRVHSTRTREGKKGPIVYGWDELIGWRLRNWECSYCGYKHTCWGQTHDLELITDGGKPIWLATKKTIADDAGECL